VSLMPMMPTAPVNAPSKWVASIMCGPEMPGEQIFSSAIESGNFMWTQNSHMIINTRTNSAGDLGSRIGPPNGSRSMLPTTHRPK
jgi:hypothetical protein